MSNPMREDLYAVIMVGKTGKNLWPVSRNKMPKHFLDLFDEGTMIANTVRRISAVVPDENILIVTSEVGRRLLSETLASFRRENIIVEPASRNTAPCIALATAHIKKRNPDALTVVLPSDHYVADEEAFIKIIEAGIDVAREKKGLVTIGIRAERPETAYGYIQVAEELPFPETFGEAHDFSLYRVKAFAEKPDFSTALQFLESKDFYWNSGIFIWHIDAISREFERSMPELYKDLLTIYESLGAEGAEKVITDVYSWIHPVSIDYGIMEKAEPVFVLTGEYGWTDLGCWDEVLKIAVSRSVVVEEHPDPRIVQVECSNIFVRKSTDKLICTIGVSDLIIVETPEALLICRKGESRRVGGVVDQLRREGQEKYL